MTDRREDPRGATPLTPDDLRGLRLRHVTTRGLLDEVEQANVAQGLRWLARTRGGDILDDVFVRRLHRELFGEVWAWAGTYRLRETNIGVAPQEIAVQLRLLLDDARTWCEQDVYPAVEAAVRFHHRMVQIHPFPNGNGRHARIAADEFLKRYFDRPPIEWASGYDLQRDNARRRAYLDALRRADGGDFGALSAFAGGGAEADSAESTRGVRRSRTADARN